MQLQYRYCVPGRVTRPAHVQNNNDAAERARQFAVKYSPRLIAFIIQQLVLI